MSIIRNAKRRNYVAVDNTVVQDRRLSWAARGLLVFLLSKPSQWTISVSHLIQQSPGGRDLVYGLLRELRKYGYMRQSKARTGGKFQGTAWDVFESPCTDLPDTENPDAVPPCTASPDTVSPDTGNPTLVNTEKDSKTEKSKGTPAGAPTKLTWRTDPEFQEVVRSYPRRSGANRWPEAYRSWCKRLKEKQPDGKPITAQVILAGLRRFDLWCNRSDKIGTEYVMQPATFLGTGLHFLEPWTLPEKKARDERASMPRTDDGWIAKGESLGLRARPGESMPEFQQRVLEKLRELDHEGAPA